jgi:hypothetical protein
MSREGEGRERRGAERRLELRELGSVRGEDKGEVLEAGVVADQHHRVDSLGHGANSLQQHVGGSGIELCLEAYGRAGAERLSHPLECFACAQSGGAEDKLRFDFVPNEVPCDPLRVAAPSRRQRPILVGESLIKPAGFRVPKEIEGMHRSGASISRAARRA